MKRAPGTRTGEDAGWRVPVPPGVRGGFRAVSKAAAVATCVAVGVSVPAPGSDREESRSDGRGGVKLRQIGSFDSPHLHSLRARLRRPALRGRARRSDHRPARRQAGRDVPRHRRHRLDRRRAGTALGRVPARLRELPALLRLLHGPKRRRSRSTTSAVRPHRRSRRSRHQGRRSSRSRTPALPTTTAERSPSAPTESSTSPPATAAFEARTPRTAAACSASCCGSIRGRRRVAATGSRREIPYRKRGGENEIFAAGLRNPFRFSFDRRKPMLAIGDVGESRVRGGRLPAGERGPGRQLRLARLRGPRPARRRRSAERPTIRPMHAYSHAGGNCAVTGGVTVHDSALKSLRGRYLYADLCAGELRSFRPQPEGQRRPRRPLPRPRRRLAGRLRRGPRRPRLRRLPRRAGLSAGAEDARRLESSGWKPTEEA